MRDPARPPRATPTRSCAISTNEKLDPVWILDTHPHADHFSAASLSEGEDRRADRDRRPHRRGPGALAALYNWPELATDGSQWDRLFAAGDCFSIGDLDVGVMFSPGHTLASVTYVVGDAAFIHDTLFMPDSGTARADFPGGSSSRCGTRSRRSFPCPMTQGYSPATTTSPAVDSAEWESTVAEQKRSNVHISKYSDRSGITPPCATRATRHCRCPG